MLKKKKMLKSFMVAIKNFQVILKFSSSFFHGVPTNCLFLVTLTGPTRSLRNSIFWGYSSPLLNSAAKNIFTHNQQKSKSMFILWSGYWAWDACSREIGTERAEGYPGSVVCMGGNWKQPECITTGTGLKVLGAYDGVEFREVNYVYME